jgi:hypothetical protein
MKKEIKETTSIIEETIENNSEKETEEVKENPLLKDGYIEGPREIKKMKFVKIEEEKVNV